MTAMLGALLVISMANAEMNQGRISQENDLDEVIYFNIPKGFAKKSLDKFGKTINRPIFFMADQIKGIVLNRVKGKMSVQDAVSLLVEDTVLSISVDEETNVLVVKIDPEALNSQSGVGKPIKKKDSNSRQTEDMKTKSSTIVKSILSALTLGLMGHSNAVAQEGAYVNDEIIELATYVVTATRREENLQKVPVSVTAFSQLDLEDKRVFEIQDIARYTPGFNASSFSNSSPNFAIRGAMNTFSQAGANKPVGIFIDDVFIPRNSASSFDLFDIEQISVLRGPQGTLFGRNVTGGAVQISTVKPKIFERSLLTKLSAGNLGYIEAAGAVNVGLTDESAIRFSVASKRRDGYITDRFNGLDYNDMNTLGMRGSYLVNPTDNFELVFTADYTKDDNNSRGYTLVSNSAGTDFSDNDGDIRTAELDTPQEFDRTIAGVSMRGALKLEAGELVSVTAYRSSESHEFYSLGAGAVELPTVANQYFKDEQDDPVSFSQELRFVSNENDRLDYIVGAYYYNEDTDRQLNDVLLGVNGNAVFFDRFYDVNAKTKSYAGFTDLVFHLSDKIDLSVGGRYTKEEKEIVSSFTDNRNAGNSFTLSPDKSFSEFTSRVSLNWEMSENANLFVSRTEGFTAGGFNTESNLQVAIEGGFDPETVTSYELGLKSVWLNNRLLLNVTGFNEKFKDKQEGFLLPEERYFSIFNAAEATSRGIEIESSFATTENLTLHMSYAFLDAEYDSFVIPGGDSYTGNKMQNAPEHSFSVAANYWVPFEDVGSINLNLGYSWQDDYYTGASNSPYFLIDAYGLMNASIAFNFNDSRTSIRLWASNLLDEDYVQIRGTSGAIAEYYGAPRTYGITLVWEF